MEIWKDIEGYEGLYQVSNLGRVKSLDRVVEGKSSSTRLHRGKILSPGIGSTGYYMVVLYKDGGGCSYTVHRLVSNTFIPNPHNHPYINHKDENKLNNNVDNLEWCTHQYNMNYGTANLRRGESRKKAWSKKERVS